MSSTELAVRSEVNVAELKQTAQLLAASGYFEAKGSAEQAVAQLATKILAGREMGFGPYASVNGIHIIQGKPTVSANLMAAAVKASGRYDYRVRQMEDNAVSIEFIAILAGGKRESLGISTFTEADAKKAGTQNLQKFARNMLFARAMSNGVRWYCPDVFMAGGVYTPEEMGAQVDGDTGEIIESTSRPVQNGDVAFQDEDADDAKATRTLLGTMHGIGRQLYGDTWDDKRHELARKLSKGRTASSEELTNAEVMKMIEGMGDKLRKQQEAQPELVAAGPVYQ